MKTCSDNTAVITCINNMGGIRPEEMNELSKQKWQFCCDRNIWITAVHVPVKENVADID